MKRIWAAAVAFVALCGADAPPPSGGAVDLAAAFGARESLADISLSPDGQTLAFIVPTTGQGAILYTLSTTPGSVQKAALSVAGDPERLDHCHWVSNTRLVCTIYGVSKVTDEAGTDQIYPFSRIFAVDAAGGAVKMLSARENEFYSRGVTLNGGEVIDWLSDSNDAVLMARPHLPEDHLDGPYIREASPAQNAAAIKVPVLLFHAELDRNVRIAESRLMDAKLSAAGVPHELVTWPKLEHYLDDGDARATMLRKSDAFLRASMGM